MSIDLIELKDYELIPAEDDEQAWAVRILSGDFVETVIRYGAISFNEIEEGMMTFNFAVISSPDPELTTENVELQNYVGDLLQAIIRDGIQSGSVMTKERESE
jgi:hypothetical protein